MISKIHLAVVLFTLILRAHSAEADTISQSDATFPRTIALKVQASNLSEVRLLAGPLQHATEFDRRYLLSFDTERLLHNFRVNAGLSSSAEPLGGWEAPNCELRGHFVGHYLSACALLYASTGDTHPPSSGNQIPRRIAHPPGLCLRQTHRNQSESAASLVGNSRFRHSRERTKANYSKQPAK
jgi:Beta-L-arabinofuranosidase, GH127 catalytic domain